MTEEKKRIFQFTNGVAYPFHGGYHIRIGKKWMIIDSCDYPNYYQLAKQERVHRYIYPFVQWSKDEYEVIYLDTNVNTLNIKEFVGETRLAFSKR